MNREIMLVTAYLLTTTACGYYMLYSARNGDEEVGKTFARLENAYFITGLVVFISALLVPVPDVQTFMVICAVAFLAFTFHNWLTKFLVESVFKTIDYRVYIAFLLLQSGIIYALEVRRGVI